MVSSEWNGEDVPRALGRYLLLKRIARGGMGEVFLASTTGIEGAERPVVVKIIRREHATDPSFIARFLDEARVQAQLQHSGVAQVIEATIDDSTGEPYAVVEHVEGRSLGDLRARALQIGQSLAWAEAVALGALIAEALAHVHERLDASGKALAIVHRDLSPQNVMVSYAGEVKIIDFGTARGQNRRCHTVAGVVFAKPGYVAPEVANGDSGDARVDVYALGVMLWELCAGRRFLQGDAAAHMSAVARHAKDLPPIAAEVGAPPELDAILARLTAFDREVRGASRAAASELARLLSSAPALSGGERGVRARVGALMTTLFPGEPSKGRREFARLVAAARAGGNAKDARLVAKSPPPPAAAPIAKEGDLLGGTRYRLLREIGRGATSLVYEADHLDLGKHVAIKILESGNASQEARFRKEGRILSRLEHDGLVRVLDVGQASDGRVFCVMELLHGETLEARLSREPRPAYGEILALASRVLAALEVAHGAALVHRDIKPANVFLPRPLGSTRPRGELAVKLLDFGVAHHESDTGDDGAKPAGVSMFGTPEYMAPEQASSANVDARADLYSLGCVMYEMLTARLPFQGDSALAILDAKAKGKPERPRSAAPTADIPEAVDALVMKALARHPSERFQTAGEMRAAIESAVKAPLRGGRARLVAAGVVAALMGLTAVAGAAKSPRLRAAITPAPKTEVTVIAAAPVASPSSDPEPVAAVDATPGEDGLDVGEDGDMVDDAPRPVLTAAPVAEAPPTDPVPPPAASTAVAAADKPHRHKHRSKGAKKASAAGNDPAPTADDAPPPKKDKPRRKHKSKVAEVQ